jgi:hypothetical protein
MMKILITYASAHGTTQSIAERMCFGGRDEDRRDCDAIHKWADGVTQELRMDPPSSLLGDGKRDNNGGTLGVEKCEEAFWSMLSKGWCSETVSSDKEGYDFCPSQIICRSRYRKDESAMKI